MKTKIKPELLAALALVSKSLPELIPQTAPSSTRSEFSDAELAELQGLSGKEKKARVLELKVKYATIRQGTQT